MRVYKAEAIVIRRTNLGEADRIVTLLSRDQGKIAAVAKGARKPKSRFAGRLELFTHLRVLLAVGRTLDVVSQVEVVEPFASVREDLTTLGHASVVVEAADRATPDREPVPEVFTLVRTGLELIRGGEGEVAVAWFAARLLVAIGYAPRLGSCVVCGRRLAGPCAFSYALGGTVCETDRARDPHAVPVSSGLLKTVEFLLRASPSVLPRLTPDPRMGAQVGELLQQYLEHRLEVRLRSPQVIQQLRAKRP